MARKDLSSQQFSQGIIFSRRKEIGRGKWKIYSFVIIKEEK